MSLLCALCFFACTSGAFGILGSLRNALLGEHPFVVSLRSSTNSHFCSGSIISDSWIATAANCVYGREASSLKIVAGTTQRNKGGTSYKTDEIIVHEYYDPQNRQNDIALLHTSTPMKTGAVVSTIELATDSIPTGTQGVVSSWGLSTDPSQQNNLMYVNVTTLPNATCNKYFRMSERSICAGASNGQESSCQGDSGGPLTVNGKLMGIVSYGRGCALAAPAIYANVRNLRSWIKSKTGV